MPTVKNYKYGNKCWGVEEGSGGGKIDLQSKGRAPVKVPKGKKERSPVMRRQKRKKTRDREDRGPHLLRGYLNWE